MWGVCSTKQQSLEVKNGENKRSGHPRRGGEEDGQEASGTHYRLDLGGGADDTHVGTYKPHPPSGAVSRTWLVLGPIREGADPPSCAVRQPVRCHGPVPPASTGLPLQASLAHPCSPALSQAVVVVAAPPAPLW